MKGAMDFQAAWFDEKPRHVQLSADGSPYKVC